MEKQLCSHDLSVLDMMFDSVQCESKVKEATKSELDEIDVKDMDEGCSPAVLESKKFEIEGVKLAELGNYEEALNKFTKAIEIAPKRPSSYNNRAQTHRFLNNDDLAIADLNNAIELSGDAFKLTKCRAFCQRGTLSRKCGNNEAARDDFNESAKLGSKFARQQLVELNPYAQLCGQMMNEVIRKLK
ncbi:unnamed protein product [Diamesa tonsa]